MPRLKAFVRCGATRVFALNVPAPKARCVGRDVGRAGRPFAALAPRAEVIAP
jgi:hypothetical protein